MAFNTESLIIFLLVILPGVTASTYARLYVPRPRPPTALEEIAAAFQNAVLVHVVGVFLLTALLLAWIQWRGPLDQDLLLTNGVTGYFQRHPGRVIFVGILYACYLLLAGPLVGATDVSHRLTTCFLAGLRSLTRWHPLVSLIPPHALADDPVWYAAFHVRRNTEPGRSVYVRVRMKNKDIYTGTLVVYPVLGDDVKSKDFLITDVNYDPGGDMEQRQRLTSDNITGFGGVLLNTSDVDAIELTYYSTQNDH